MPARVVNSRLRLLLFVILLTFAALGWYLNWYQINFNTPKITEDVKKGGTKVRELLEKVSKKDKTASTEASKEAAAPEPTQP